MRENLIFTGVPLPTQNDEDTEEILKNFHDRKNENEPCHDISSSPLLWFKIKNSNSGWNCV
jgi:hypothetical protein